MISLESLKDIQVLENKKLENARSRIESKGVEATDNDYWALGFIEGKLVALESIIDGWDR